MNSSRRPSFHWKNNVPLIILVLIFGLEFFYRYPLRESSLETIPQMQQNDRLAQFFSIVSTIGGMQISFLILSVVIHVANFKQALYYWLAFGASQWLFNILRMVYASPRPFMLTDEI